MHLLVKCVSNITKVFNITQYLREEVDYVVWHTALNGLNYIKSELQLQPCYANFKVVMIY